MLMNISRKLKLHLATFGNAAMTSHSISAHLDRALKENVMLCCADGLRFAVSCNREKQQIVTADGHPHFRSRNAGRRQKKHLVSSSVSLSDRGREKWAALHFLPGCRETGVWL